MQNLLQIRDLKISVLGKKLDVPLLDKISLNVVKGQCLGIVGESGCGKSITANALLGLLPYPLSANGGTANFSSETFGLVDLLHLPMKTMRSIRGREISMIFQEPMTSLDPVFQVQDQMYEAISFHNSKASNQEMRERCLQMLAKVNIPRPEQTLASYPHQLSGGQLQRIMIAIALMNNPRLLIADEPTTALDVTIQAQILELMNELKHNNDASVIMITHDLGVIAETSDHVAVFYAGHIVEEAPVAEIFHNPAHPYTQGLLKSIASLTGNKSDLYAIPGTVPAGGGWKQHCRFVERCEFAFEPCRKSLPALVEVSAGHLSRCFLHSDEVEI